jgi:hypothetical protein
MLGLERGCSMEPEEGGEGKREQADEQTNGSVNGDSASSPGQPPGLARAARELEALLSTLRQDHLTEADRTALRALLDDLRRLARAPSDPAAPNDPGGG